jgi:Tfp pilus assembly protein PilE
MSTQAKKAVRAELATRVFVVAILALFAITAWGVVLIRNQQTQSVTTLQSAKAAAASAARTAKTIESCTTPGQPCFQRSQKATGKAVANINRVVILAAACAVDQHGSVVHIQTAIQSCVIERLAADQNRSNR